MTAGNVQMKLSIISVPDKLAPLKLRGYLQQEAAEIQAHAARNSFIIIYLYLPERILFAVTQKKLDTVLEGIVNKHSCIHRIELRVVSQGLGPDDMQDAIREAEADLSAMVEDAKRFMEQGDPPQPPTVH